MNKKVRFKKIISVLFITAFLLSISVPTMAEKHKIGPELIDPKLIVPEEFAVYLNNNLQANNFQIKGDIYSAKGDVILEKGNKRIEGDIYLNVNNKLIVAPDGIKLDHEGKVYKLKDTPFDAPDKYFPPFPVIENKVDTFIASDNPNEIVTEDTHYTSLVIDDPLVVDVTLSNRSIVVDKIKFSGNGYIKLKGKNNLFLYVHNDLTMSGDQNIKGNDGYNVKTHVFVEGNVDLLNNDTETKMYANLYTKGNSITIETTELYGNIVSNTVKDFKDFNTSSGGTNGTNFYGTVYVPKAKAVMSSSSLLKGRFVADSLDLKGGKIEITYDEKYATLEMPFDEPSITYDIPEGPSLLEDLLNFPYAYLYGDGYGSVFPNYDIKREEAVAVIYRLLKQNNLLEGFHKGAVEAYENIESDRWSRPALEFMKYIGVYKEDYIDSGASVTRGEIAKIVAFALRIRPDDTKPIDFVDLSKDNQYYYYIKALVDEGYLIGWKDRIMPDKEMTRAEFATMVNRMIGRDDRYEVIDVLNPYPIDLVRDPYDTWPFDDVFRASFGYSEDTGGGKYNIDPDNKYPIDDLNDY